MEQNNISEQENDLQMNEKKGNKKTDEKESTAKTILEYVISIGIAIVAALLINNFILLNAKVPSGSMENTIMTGDRLFGFRLSYLMEDPKRGDIVIFKYPDNESINYIKRIIGLPGETVTIKDSKVYINNSATPLKEERWGKTILRKQQRDFTVPMRFPRIVIL